MSVDPSDPETFENADSTEDTGTGEPDAEAPEADAAEQQHELLPQHDEQPAREQRNAADEADLAEQARVVELNEDDYR
jgi:hypothetical protein